MKREDVKLGSLIDGPAQRDAIHIAVAPVVAGEPLLPGQHGGLDSAVAESALKVVLPPEGLCASHASASFVMQSSFPIRSSRSANSSASFSRA